MGFARLVLGALLYLSVAAASVAADLPVLRISVLKFGTVNWELDTIRRLGLDTSNGFSLQVQGVANNAANRIAFQAGEVDCMVADWIWVARQRAAGKDFVFIPYSRAVGGLMIPHDDPAQSLADLSGRKIAIAGGPVDKSWLILQAYARQAHDLDLARATEQVFAAPPLVMQAALSGEVDAAINFWHFSAKMKAAGMRELISVDEAATALGLDPATPLLGYVVTGGLIARQPDLVAGLQRASRAAKDVLARDDAAWEALRERMRPKSEAEFEALKAGFRAGIPDPAPVEEAAVARMLALMAALGGEKLVGKATELPDGVFYQPN